MTSACYGPGEHLHVWQDAIKRVLKSWRAEHVFTEGALGEIESALGVVDEEMAAAAADAAEAEVAARASAPAGPAQLAAVELPVPAQPAFAELHPAPASHARCLNHLLLVVL